MGYDIFPFEIVNFSNLKTRDLTRFSEFENLTIESGFRCLDIASAA
jgi:hypothetical protein